MNAQPHNRFFSFYYYWPQAVAVDGRLSI